LALLGRRHRRLLSLTSLGSARSLTSSAIRRTTPNRAAGNRILSGGHRGAA
jgi:hypothetical protein